MTVIPVLPAGLRSSENNTVHPITQGLLDDCAHLFGCTADFRQADDAAPRRSRVTILHRAEVYDIGVFQETDEAATAYRRAMLVKLSADNDQSSEIP